MSQALIGVVGILIGVGMTLAIISVFTTSWVVDTATGGGIKESINVGIVPYQSELPTWFHLICFAMYGSLGFGVLSCLAYFFAVWKAKQHGCCQSIRHAFYLISAFASPMGILEMFSFFMAIINAPFSENEGYGKESQYVGYSGYLALASGLIMSVASGFSTSIARRHCH